MKSKLITLFLILRLINCYSQNEKFAITFCPLSLIDEISFPTIQGGLEFKLSNKFTLYNEFGIKYRKGYFEVSDTSFLRSSGFKIKTEIRYYLTGGLLKENDKDPMSRFYLGGNIFYNRDYYNSEISYYPNKDSTFLAEDNFAIKKNILGLNLILGVQLPITSKLMVDLYSGLGFRQRIINNMNREYNSDRDRYKETIDLTFQGIKDNIDTKEGFSGTPNLTLGFRLCYKFTK